MWYTDIFITYHICTYMCDCVNISRVNRYTYFLTQLETLKSALSHFQIWTYNSGPHRWAGTTKFRISSN